ncbi:MAG: HEAT repeat domain-containing protein [Chitinophagaceae bacterium]
MANNDPDKRVKAKALEILVKQNDKKYLPLFTKYVNDSSYSVVRSCFRWLNANFDPANAYSLAKKFSADAKGKLGSVISATMLVNGTEEDYSIVFNQYKNAPPNEEKIRVIK